MAKYVLQICFIKNITFFSLAIPALKPKSEDNFFKASARIYGEFFSRILSQKLFPIEESFAKFPAKRAAGSDKTSALTV